VEAVLAWSGLPAVRPHAVRMAPSLKNRLLATIYNSLDSGLLPTTFFSPTSDRTVSFPP